MVMDNNNNENSFLSELTIKGNQRFVSEKLRVDDTVANIKKASQRYSDNSKRFISDQSKDPDMEEKTIQTTKKRKQKKNYSKVDISKNNSNDQRLNNDEFTDEEIDGIIDQPYGIILILLASNISSCIW